MKALFSNTATLVPDYLKLIRASVLAVTSAAVTLCKDPMNHPLDGVREKIVKAELTLQQ